MYMNTRIVFALSLALLIVPAAFAQHDHGVPATKPVSTASVAAMVDGVVKRVDKGTTRITIAHEPLTNLGMPKMTMAFKVRDAKWLELVKEGDRIRFVADNVNGSLTVVALESAR
jgi:Cu(I)/Ag(I) efflux system periplasmic protein CusF